MITDLFLLWLLRLSAFVASVAVFFGIVTADRAAMNPTVVVISTVGVLVFIAIGELYATQIRIVELRELIKKELLKNG